MLAFFTDVSFAEILLVGAVALIIFGRRLPEVAMRAGAQFVRLRRQLSTVWRQTGLEEELRKVRREIDLEERKLSAQIPDWRKDLPDWRDSARKMREGIREVESEATKPVKGPPANRIIPSKHPRIHPRPRAPPANKAADEGTWPGGFGGGQGQRLKWERAAADPRQRPGEPPGAIHPGEMDQGRPEPSPGARSSLRHAPAGGKRTLADGHETRESLVSPGLAESPEKETPRLAPAGYQESGECGPRGSRTG